MPTRTNHHWTKSDTEFLLENYEKLGPVKCSEILQIPYPTIIYQAKKNGLTKDYALWSEEETQYLIDNHDKMPYRKIAAHLGRTESAIENRIYKLAHGESPQITPRSAPWTEKETRILKRMHRNGTSDTKIAERLGRSATKIGTTRAALNLPVNYPPGKPWTDSDNQYLIQHYNTDGAAACAAHLNRTPQAVHQQVARLKRRKLMPKRGRNQPRPTSPKQQENIAPCTEN